MFLYFIMFVIVFYKVFIAIKKYYDKTLIMNNYE